MHEFSICDSLVKTILDELGKIEAPYRLLKARVVVGDLRQIVRETLQFAYGILTKDTEAEGSTLEIIPEPIEGQCPHCGREGALEGGMFFCPTCGKTGVKIEKGSSLYLDSLEIETP